MLPGSGGQSGQVGQEVFRRWAVDHRTLGRTGLRVSEIGFGGISVGRPRWGVTGPGDRPEPDEAEAIRAIHRALDLGINFFDTAPNYGNRESERVFGKALKGRRDQCLIATKCGHFFSPEKSYIKDHTPELSARSIDDSLRTMGIETLDLIQIHSAPPEVVRKGDVLEVLKRAQAAGKVRFIGVTTDNANDAEVCRAVMKDGGYDALQVTYNVLRRDLAVAGILREAAQNGLGIIVKSPLGTGAFTHKFRSLPEARKTEQERIARLEPILGGTSRTIAQLALRYVLSNPHVSTVIAGTKQVAHVEENAEVGDGQGLSKEMARKLEEAVG
jgi:aryl-alcohol dehydrogenase-like predicted oxidoreductase